MRIIAATATVSLWAVAGCDLFGPDRRLGLEAHTVTALTQTEWGLFAGTQFGGVFRLDDWTGEWESLGLDHAVISSMVFVSGSSDRLLVGVNLYAFGDSTEAAIFATSNGSGTWEVADGGLAATREGRIGVSSLAHDPGPPERLFLGRSYSILRSEDGGESWTFVLGDEQSAGQGVRTIVISPERDGVIWASAQSALGLSFIFRSADWGDSWESMTPYPRTEVAYHALLVDPEQPTRVWAGMDGGVIFSDDQGENWVESLTIGASVVALLPTDTHLFAVSNEPHFPDDDTAPFTRLGMHRRAHGTDSWEEIEVPSEIPGALSAALDDRGRLVVGTDGGGVWRWDP